MRRGIWWLLAGVVIAIAILRKPGPDPMASAPMPGTTGAECLPPPALDSGSGPVQSGVPWGTGPFRLAGALAHPLAGFSVDARVLGSERYRFGREAEFSPVDLALGWGPMRDDAVLSRLQISQSGRWFHYRWEGEPPLPPGEIVRNSANMHMIPASPDIAAALADIGRGERVRIDGWLVRVEAPDGWGWRSSLSREDQGQGACELVYVCRVTRH